MKKVLLISLILVLGLAVNGWAVTYQGAVDNENGGLVVGGVFSAGEWDLGYFGLSWTVSSSGSLWTYNYRLVIDRLELNINLKELSHVIIEVSPNFTVNNIIEATDFGDGGGLDTYGPGGSNPFMPATEKGIKWNGLADTDTSEDTLTYEWFITSNRAPMWGDFYAVDGKKPGEEVYAYNTGFLFTTNAAVGDGNAMDSGGHAWILVPDTQGQQIPEPSTLLLIGTGLLGLGIFRRRSKK